MFSSAAERDAVAYVAFLDVQRQVNKAKKIGTHGYCLGGPQVVRTAAAPPDRVGASASFHGGFLATDKPNSPYLLAPKIKARLYFAIASDDDKREPDVKDKLKEAFAPAKFRRRSKSIRKRSTAGACPTPRRLTTSPMLTAPGATL